MAELCSTIFGKGKSFLKLCHPPNDRNQQSAYSVCCNALFGQSNVWK